MVISSHDYSAMVSQLQPAHAVDVLNERVREVGKLNGTIADWFQERRKLEEQYAAGLKRLARKPLEDADLGIFSVPWSAITSSAETLAESHAALASKIDTDVERALRTYTTSSRELQGMTTIQGNLASLARDVDRARMKVDKLKDKNGDAFRTAEADREYKNAQAQWESQSPYVFDHLQTADEARLNHLRDVLTQLHTHEADQVERDRGIAEHCLNILLQVETTDEIKTFVLKTLSGSGTTDRLVRPSTSNPARPSSSQLTPTQSNQDQESQFSGHDDKRKSRFGGLKRLGTVVGKRDSKKRESKISAGLGSQGESSDRSAKSSFNPLAGKFGRSKDTSALEATAEEPQELSTPRPASPKRVGSELLESPQVSDLRSSSVSRTINQSGRAPNGLISGGEDSAVAPTVSGLSVVESPTNGLLQTPDVPGDRQDAVIDEHATSQIFNVNIRDAPAYTGRHQEAETALSSVASTLQAPPVASRANTVRGRRGIRNSVIPSTYYPPDETSQTHEQPGPSVTSVNRSDSDATGGLSAIQPESASNTIIVPSDHTTRDRSNQATALVADDAAAVSDNAMDNTIGTNAFSASGSPSAVRGHDNDNSSLRSGVSNASQALKTGDLHALGLRASVIETVNVRLEKGDVISASLHGEITLAYTSVEMSSSLRNETIRVASSADLEKLAPNPAIVETSPTGIVNEFSIKLSTLRRPQAAFKYQATPASAASLVPLIITTAVKVESKQTSVIVSYSLNPAFKTGSDASITLNNVMLGLTLEGSNAIGCQSRPIGTFSREKNLIFWQIGDITMESGRPAEKLLARFSTETAASSASAEARWEITGSSETGAGSGLAVVLQHHGHGSDPFADEDAAAGGGLTWKPAPGSRRVVSGHYIAT